MIDGWTVTGRRDTQRNAMQLKDEVMKFFAV